MSHYQPSPAEWDDPTFATVLEDVPACPVKDCSLPVDVILQSSDGLYLGAHSSNLQKFSEGFPTIPSAAALAEDHDVPAVEESAELLELLLRFMHRVRLPDVGRLPVDTLAALAEAVEKYKMYSAVELCKAHMNLTVEKHPVDVCIYAVKYGYNDLADKAVRFTLAIDSSLMVAKASQTRLDLEVVIHWFRYRDAWADAMRAHAIVPPSAGACLHKGGVEECSLWKPFFREVVLAAGVELSGPVGLDLKIGMMAAHMLAECTHCTKRASYWAHLASMTQTSRTSTFFPDSENM